MILHKDGILILILNLILVKKLLRVFILVQHFRIENAIYCERWAQASSTSVIHDDEKSQTLNLFLISLLQGHAFAIEKAMYPLKQNGKKINIEIWPFECRAQNTSLFNYFTVFH